MIPSKTFCIYPFTHLATLTNGTLIPCCVAGDEGRLNLHQKSLGEAWNSTYMKSVRQKMLKGEKVGACARCYAEEDNGLESHRVSSNRHALHQFGGSLTGLLSSVAEDGAMSADLMSLDLRLGNTCNLKCVMCRPSESSKWQGEIQSLLQKIETPEVREDLEWKGRVDREKFAWYKKPEFWEPIYKMLPQMREFIFGGGEPLMIDELKTFLKECVKRGEAGHLKLRFHTNATYMSEEWLELFTHFREVQLMLSIDGLAEQNHYMRNPADWEKILATLKRLDETPPMITVFLLLTVHALSLFYLPEFAEWKLKQNFMKVAVQQHYAKLFNTGLVHDPIYINVQVYSPEVKEFVHNKFRDFYGKMKPYFAGEEKQWEHNVSRFEGLMQYMKDRDLSERLPQFKDYLKSLDTVRGTSYHKTFPELADRLRI